MQHFASTKHSLKKKKKKLCGSHHAVASLKVKVQSVECYKTRVVKDKNDYHATVTHFEHKEIVWYLVFFLTHCFLYAGVFLVFEIKSHNDKAKNYPSSIRALFEPCGECTQVKCVEPEPITEFSHHSGR